MLKLSSCDNRIKPTPWPRLIAFVLLFFSRITLAAENLPELDFPSTDSGAPTSARFFGGASADGSQTYQHQFDSDDNIDIAGEIHVEPQHINLPGNLYIVVELDGQFYMRDTRGIYLQWNLNLATLKPTVHNKPLSSVEPISVIDNLNLGNLGYAGATISVYLAYDLTNGLSDLHYSGTPITLTLADYDPLELSGSTSEILDLVIFDEARDREIPVLIYRPETTDASPVLLFSHGLGGSRFNVTYLAEHWSSRGYTVVNMQHHGSDSSIWNVPPSQFIAAFEAAASLENSIARIDDVSAVIDQLELWNSDAASLLFQRLDLSKLGMSGHSFGAVTTKLVSGEDVNYIARDTRDPRIKASTLFSPSITASGDPAEALAGVEIPWLLMTGTLDVVSIGSVGASVEERLAVFPALPQGNFYELVLFEGEHHAFTDNAIRPSQNPRNPAHHDIIRALSSAFWDSWLLNNLSARNWLKNGSAETVLEPGDTWQYK